MRLAIAPEAGEARVGHARFTTWRRRRDGERGVAPAELAVGEVGERDATRPRSRGREAAGNHLRREVQRVNEGPADVRRDRADPHPGERLAQPRLEGGHQVADGVGRGELLGATRPRQLGRGCDREPRVDRSRPDRQHHRHGVDVEQVGSVHEDVGSPAEAGLGERGVDGTSTEDRRDRQALRVEATVGDDEDIRAPLGRLDGFPREPLERGGEPLLPVGGKPPGIEPSNAPAPVDERRKQAVEIGQDRAGEAERGSGSRRATEEGRPSTDLHPQVHHDPLALRVDRRVRDLGKCLPQVVGHRPVEPRTTGRRRVVAHAPQGLVRLEGHRLDVQPCTLGVETREVAELGRFKGRIVNGAVAGTVLMGRARLVVDRQVSQDPGLRLGVFEHLAPPGIDKQHLARSEASATDRLGRRERHGTRLRGDSHQPARGDGERGRTQAVPVDHRADPPAIGEHQCRGSVPRRQEPRGPAAERGHVGVRRAPQRERLGDRGEERLRQVPARAGEELEALVERQGIGTVRREQRAGFDQLGRDRLSAAVPGAPPNLLAVAADGVDLAVVGDRPEGLGEPPHGMRVRRIALVEERVADHERFGQVGVQLGEPRPRDETLVDHGSARR